jgi:hypothetical protein
VLFHSSEKNKVLDKINNLYIQENLCVLENGTYVRRCFLFIFYTE